MAYENLDNEPEAFGLVRVANLDDDGGWEWAVLRVWADSDGLLFYACDAGRSDSSRFEDVQTIDDLHALHTTEDEDRFTAYVLRWQSDHSAFCKRAEAIEFLQDVHRTFRLPMDQRPKYKPEEADVAAKIVSEWQYRVWGMKPDGFDCIDVCVVRYDLLLRTSEYATADGEGVITWTEYPEGQTIGTLIRIGGIQQAKLALSGNDDVKALLALLKKTSG